MRTVEERKGAEHGELSVSLRSHNREVKNAR